MEEDLQVCLLFPGWEAEDEHVAVISPHDDDGLLGAGYAILAALANEAEVYPSSARACGRCLWLPDLVLSKSGAGRSNMVNHPAQEPSDREGGARDA